MHILVEGNIGAGKSTLINFLKEKHSDKIVSYSEPVDKWQSVYDTNLFDLMYKDPKRWMFTFQCFTNLTRRKLFDEMKEENIDYPIKIFERSLFSAQLCFVENSYSMKLINDTEYKILKEWYDFYIRDVSIDLIIYLRSDPETCLQRINLRSRNEEKNISIDYIQKLHYFYEKWLINGEVESNKGRIKEIVVLNSENNLNEMYKVYDTLVKDLLSMYESKKNELNSS